MKHLLSVMALLLTANLWGQNPFEKEILRTKYTIDSLVASERMLMYKKEKAVKALLEEKKITEEQSKLMLKEIKAAWKHNSQLHSYKEGLRLAKLIKQKATGIQIDTLPATSLDSLMVASQLKETYDQKLKATDTLQKAHIKKDDLLRINLRVALGIQQATNANSYFKTGVESELGITLSSRLNPEKRLFFVYGLVWQNNTFSLKNNNYLVPEGKDVKLTPYTLPLKSAKLRVNYLTLPLELQKRYNSNFRIGVGAYVGLLIDVNQKLKYTEADDNYKLFVRNNLNVNKLTYGLSAEIGYGSISLYAKYSLSPLFQNSPANVHPFSIGIKF
jgi:hypothetical protein